MLYTAKMPRQKSHIKVNPPPLDGGSRPRFLGEPTLGGPAVPQAPLLTRGASPSGTARLSRWSPMAVGHSPGVCPIAIVHVLCP